MFISMICLALTGENRGHCVSFISTGIHRLLPVQTSF